MGFIAKYDSGTCPRCRDPIEAGQEVETYSGGRHARYVHVSCPSTANVKCSICGGQWVNCGCP